ncbi:WcaF family extracellular polysaccharide biosynthesis acetyltransferase [Marinoscillum pacificum]|uniref:WcaF family extracellular polysaccharide biosynthesis acetyltransferase n=1 Tax=Marinoscillum pacificum TaxID=392723 RepID=UPI0021573512|nr:WcaF family extracellular polysaccharide biosynthesis acetyltransferase [Marinoscillum pacificum]
MDIVDKSTFNNSWYNPGGSTFKRYTWYFVNVLVFINPLVPFYGIKRKLLKLYGAKIGKRLIIKPGVNIKYPWLLEIGDYVSIGENVWIDNLGKTTLHDHTTISQGAMLLTGNHDFKSTSFDLIVKEIVIEKGAWIGAQSTVCPGATCRDHSILTAGSVATKDLEAYGIYQGNPAVKVKTRQIV